MEPKKTNKPVRCINGSISTYSNCIGFCNSYFHRGYITKNIEQAHKCIERKCKSFRPIKENPYWINKQKEQDKKNRIKEIRKKHKEMEKEIIRVTPEQAKPVFCKQLYDSMYLLVINERFMIQPNYYRDILDIRVFVKFVPEKNVKI